MRRKLVLVQLKGGLGNQMFQYACGRALTEKNKCQLALDLNWFANQSLRKYELDQWNIPQVKILSKSTADKFRFLGNLPSDLQIPKPDFFWRWVFSKICYPKTSFINEQEAGWFQELHFNQTGNIYLDGYWQSEKYFQDIETIIYKEFSIKSGIPIIAVDIDNKISSLDNTVSIHIRRGDYISYPKTKNIHNICDISYYQRAVQFLEEQNINISKIFVFTDDPDWCKENYKVSYQTEIVSENNFDASTEIYLMSKCHHNIIANSSFSWWGAWLNKNPDKIVIAPQKWFTIKDVNDIICQSWHKV